MMKHTQITREAETLYLEGDLTFHSVAELLKQLLPHLAEGAVTRVVLTKVHHIDSAGLALLCELKRRDNGLYFENIPDKVQGMIALSGLSSIFSRV